MKKKPKKSKPPFTRADYMAEARILEAAAALRDGRDSITRMYRKLAMMLIYADANMPKGLPR